VLLVIESEKTDREVVKRAITLLAESKPNLGAVLNKRRSYVPKILHQEI
jgi:Mrp family chromosome partitioning ATPase